MNVFPHSRWRVIFGVLLLIWLVVVAGIGLSGLRQTFPLPVSEIRHDSGCAYLIDMTHRPVGWPITTFSSDSRSVNTRSGLLLFENGNPIGKPHTLHDKIRTYGAGYYSHWNRQLYFSTSDCSDPRSNRRHYTQTIPVDLSKWAFASWFIGVGILALIVKRHFAADQPLPQLFTFARRVSHDLFSPVDLSPRPLLSLGVFFVLVLVTVSFLMGIWSAGTSTQMAVGGFYQISDASNWWICSNALVDEGTFGNQQYSGEWCQHRAIYPTFLSGITLLGGRTMVGTLVWQTLLVTFAMFVFLRRSMLHIGVVGVTLCGFLLYRFATVHLFPHTMTENAAVIFGCIGFALLLKATENRGLPWMVAGMVMISIGLNARSGAFFILPCLVVWAGVTAYIFQKHVWQWVVPACLALMVGFALQATLVLAIGGSPGNSFGGFSNELYGLSVGGKGAHQVFTDHPEVRELPDSEGRKTIYALALENVMARPATFLEGLSKNFSVFLTRGTYNYRDLGSWGEAIKIFWWMAWIPLLLNYRHPAYLMIAMSSLGIILSAPVIGYRGSRIFSASVMIDVMQIGVAVFFTGRLLLQGLKGLFASNFERPIGKPDSLTPGPTYLEPLAGLLFLVILVIPHTPLRHLQTQSTVEVTGCQEGEKRVATRLGQGGTMLVDIVSDAQKADVLRGEIRRKDFVDGISHKFWWHDEALAFRGASVLLAYQLAANDPTAPGPFYVFSSEHLANYHGNLVQLCIDENENQVIFEYPYYRLKSISILE